MLLLPAGGIQSSMPSSSPASVCLVLHRVSSSAHSPRPISGRQSGRGSTMREGVALVLMGRVSSLAATFLLGLALVWKSGQPCRRSARWRSGLGRSRLCGALLGILKVAKAPDRQSLLRSRSGLFAAYVEAIFWTLPRQVLLRLRS